MEPGTSEMNNSKRRIPSERNHHQVETMVQMECLRPLRLYLNHITDLLATRFAEDASKIMSRSVENIRMGQRRTAQRVSYIGEDSMV